MRTRGPEPLPLTGLRLRASVQPAAPGQPGAGITWAARSPSQLSSRCPTKLSPHRQASAPDLAQLQRLLCPESALKAGEAPAPSLQKRRLCPGRLQVSGLVQTAESSLWGPRLEPGAPGPVSPKCTCWSRVPHAVVHKESSLPRDPVWKQTLPTKQCF